MPPDSPAAPDAAAQALNMPEHIEHLPTAGLTPYARNSRTHSAEQIQQIAASIREFGFTNPVLVDDAGVIIAGHGRVMAAQQIGLETVPCIRLGHLTEAQRRAYVIADNKLAEQAGWDQDLLAAELQALQADDFDLGLMGFGDDELAELLADRTEGETDPEATPEPKPDPVSQRGDVWLLGRHRLCNGDSTSADDVQAAMGGGNPHLMVTDPPYGVEYDASWRTSAGLQQTGAHGKVQNDDEADWSAAWALFPGNVAYVWHAGLHSPTVAESLSRNSYEPRALIVWAKARLVISRGHYHHAHEPCWYAVRKGKTAHWAGDRKQTALWQIAHRKSETGHSTQKPIECMRRPIINNSRPGDLVYDPFLGSGTTLIACEMEGRACRGLEFEPRYCDVIIRRWQEFTGQAATLEGDGRTFDQVARARGVEVAA